MTAIQKLKLMSTTPLEMLDHNKSINDLSLIFLLLFFVVSIFSALHCIERAGTVIAGCCLFYCVILQHRNKTAGPVKTSQLEVLDIQVAQINIRLYYLASDSRYCNSI